MAGFYTQCFLDIGNIHSVDPNAGTIALNDFAAEIVVGTHKVTFDPPGYVSGTKLQRFHIEAFQFPEVNDTIDIAQTPNLLSELENYYTELEVPEIRRFALALTDRDGGGLSFGKPVRRDIDKVITPVVVINAPPTHFDVFDDDTLDINNLYDVGLEPADIGARTDRTIYRETSSSSTTFSTTISADWAQSQTVKAGFEAYGASIGGSLSRTYGEKFEKISSSTTEVSFLMETTSLLEDRVIGYEVDYKVYEYPVYFNGNTKDTISYVVVVIPTYPQNTITKEQSALDNDYQANHQHGNLFSYAYNSDDLNLIGGFRNIQPGSHKYDQWYGSCNQESSFWYRHSIFHFISAK